MERKIDKNIEHRGNNDNVASRLLLELQLIRNINQKEPVYSFDDKDKSDKQNK